MTLPVYIVNGPNLNMLGAREPEIYGHETLSDIEARCKTHAAALGLQIECFQSNIEGELVNRLQSAAKSASGVIINAGAYSHTSLALLDAIAILKIPVIEVHLSNIYRREAYRQFSYVSQKATGVISGLGSEGYLLALTAMAKILRQAQGA